MSKHWIINDASFGKIKDQCISGESIKQFLDDVVYKHPNWDNLLQNLSNIYVLVASLGSQDILKDGETSWNDIMEKKQYDILEKNKYFIVSYMMTKEIDQNNHYIELYDTIIRKNNLGRVMINKYEDNYGVNAIPREIIQSSAKYWGETLDLYCEDIDTGKYCMYKEDIDEYINEKGLDSKDLRWKHLYDLCEEEK